MSITVMSYNVQHCRNYISGEINYDAVAATIQKYNADIIGLNEVRDEGPMEGYDAQARLLAERLGYHYYFAKAIDVAGENPYGNAILSRFPIVSAQTIPVPDPVTHAVPGGPYETRCLLKTKIAVSKISEDTCKDNCNANCKNNCKDPCGNSTESCNDNPEVNCGIEEGCDCLTICVIHFGLNIDEQENATATVLQNITNEKCILMGDFNITPDNPLLVSIGEKLFDTAALLPENTLSFPSDKPRIKIDYMFTSSDIKVLSAQIPAELTSDHRPYVLSVEV